MVKQPDKFDQEWLNTDPEDLWIFDKLILSTKLGYICGPAGVDVPEDGFYIVRPCVNFLGLGLGANIEFLRADVWTDFLPYGTFWCQQFKGDHISVDYKWGDPHLTVQGFKSDYTFTRWDRWSKIDHCIDLPKILKPFAKKYQWINCEFIGGNLIEVHLRSNPDFEWGNKEFIPVWASQSINVPEGYRYIKYPDIHGRIGAYIK